jgi:hypothetical protein
MSKRKTDENPAVESGVDEIENGAKVWALFDLKINLQPFFGTQYESLTLSGGLSQTITGNEADDEEALLEKAERFKVRANQMALDAYAETVIEARMRAQDLGFKQGVYPPAPAPARPNLDANPRHAAMASKAPPATNEVERVPLPGVDSDVEPPVVFELPQTHDTTYCTIVNMYSVNDRGWATFYYSDGEVAEPITVVAMYLHSKYDPKKWLAAELGDMRFDWSQQGVCEKLFFMTHYKLYMKTSAPGKVDKNGNPYHNIQRVTVTSEAPRLNF